MERSNSWSGVNAVQVRCPVPDCDHTGDIITNAHCRIEHNMTREQIEKQYGMPYKLTINPKVRFANLLR